MYIHMICIYIYIDMYTWSVYIYIYIYIYAHDICIYIYRYTHFKIPNRLGIKGTPGHSTRVFQPIPGTKTWRRTVAATWKRSRFAPPLPSSPTTSYRRTSCRGWNVRASWRWKIYEKMGNMQKNMDLSRENWIWTIVCHNYIIRTSCISIPWGWAKMEDLPSISFNINGTHIFYKDGREIIV